MNYKFVLIQAIGIIGTIIFFLSYQFKNNKTLFKFQMISYLLYSFHYVLLGAYAGSLTYIVSLIKSFCLASNIKQLRSKYACIVLCISQVICGVVTYNNLISILPIIANIALIVAGYSNNPKTLRFAGIFINSPLWIIYDVVVGSWAGIIDELVTESSLILSVYRFGFNKKDE